MSSLMFIFIMHKPELLFQPVRFADNVSLHLCSTHRILTKEVAAWFLVAKSWFVLFHFVAWTYALTETYIEYKKRKSIHNSLHLLWTAAATSIVSDVVLVVLGIFLLLNACKPSSYGKDYLWAILSLLLNCIIGVVIQLSHHG